MRTVLIGFTLALLLVEMSHATSPEDIAHTPVYWELAQLERARDAAKQPDAALEQCLQRLRKHADEALTRGPYSVMLKEEVPPSGDKHDYMSFSRYWWPDPKQPDGLPYIRHDGKVNYKLRERGDRDQIGMLSIDIEALTLAAYFFGEEKYAAHARKLIRVWFLDSETKMNPHMKFGQGVPGRADGRGVGILDTRGFILVLDSVALLAAEGQFPAEDQVQLHQWFTDYLHWLRTSDLGKEEASAKNNHGSWYAAQAARIAVFVGDLDVAREIVKQVQQERIANQFTDEGSQPDELKRTQSLHYSFFNLEALSVVARVGERLGMDLWETTEAGPGLKPGIDFLMPFLLKQKKWTYPQMGEFSLSNGTIFLLRMASVRYDDAIYLKPTANFSHRHSEIDHSVLLFQARQEPKPALQ